MMHGHEKSDLAIVAEKPANKAEQPTAEASTGASAAEPVERRAGTKGNCGPAKHVPGAEPDKRVTGAGTHTAICRHTPEVGAVCGKAARTVLCGGRAMKRSSLPLRAPAASWCDPAGGSPAQVRGSARLVASVECTLAK